MRYVCISQNHYLLKTFLPIPGGDLTFLAFHISHVSPGSIYLHQQLLSPLKQHSVLPEISSPIGGHDYLQKMPRIIFLKETQTSFVKFKVKELKIINFQDIVFKFIVYFKNC